MLLLPTDRCGFAKLEDIPAGSLARLGSGRTLTYVLDAGGRKFALFLESDGRFVEPWSAIPGDGNNAWEGPYFGPVTLRIDPFSDSHDSKHELGAIGCRGGMIGPVANTGSGLSAGSEYLLSIPADMPAGDLKVFREWGLFIELDDAVVELVRIQDGRLAGGEAVD